jgi:L-lysine 2,3-aminomutase
MEQFKYLGTTLTNQNSIHENINRQTEVWEWLLSKNVQTKIYRTVIFPVVLYGHETWSLTLTDECVEGVQEWGSEKAIWGKE